MMLLLVHNIGPQLLRAAQHLQALFERCPRVAHEFVEPRDAFHIVCEDGKRRSG